MIHSALESQRLLIVEDEPLLRIDLENLLQREGATVFTAACISKALQFVDVPELSAGVIDIRLGEQEADPVCEALNRRQVPFVFYTGNPDPLRDRWPATPVIGKPATAAAIVGAIKYAISTDRRDILSGASHDAHNAKIINIDQRIFDGEERVARVRCLIARLRAMGFDTSVADKLLATMAQSLEIMRAHRRLVASEKWKSAGDVSR